MDVLQEEIGKEPPWVMLYADDLVICEHSRAEVELPLETRTKTKQRKNKAQPCPEKDQYNLH